MNSGIHCDMLHEKLMQIEKKKIQKLEASELAAEPYDVQSSVRSRGTADRDLRVNRLNRTRSPIEELKVTGLTVGPEEARAAVRLIPH